MTSILDRPEILEQSLWADLDPDRRVPRRLYADRDVFDLELERLFARSWLYVGHESQIDEPGDYIQAPLGADPVIVTRDKQGEIHVLLNSCRHRGMKVCKLEEGNARAFRCEYHGWTYENTGQLIGVPFKKQAYFDELDTECYSLVEARSATYQGLIFATWWHDGPTLEEYLGGMTEYLDLVFGRDPEGVEVISGVHRYDVHANWKILSENSSGDQYHLPFVHASAVELELRDRPGQVGHTVHVGNGHCFGSEKGGIVRGASLSTEYAAFLDEVRQRAVEQKGAMAEELIPIGAGNLFPNLSFLDSMRFRFLRLRVPRSPSLTEIWGWVMVDKSIPEDVKAEVRRQAPTFFGPSGLFEQDDAEVFNSIQEGFNGYAGRKGFLDISQGLGHDTSFSERYHTELPGQMGEAFITEANHRAFYHRWLELMEMGPGPEPDATTRC